MNPRILAVVPVAVLALAACGSSSTSDGITAYVACQVEIEKVLKSPGTADYPPMSTTRHYNEGNRWDFRSYVDSQNGFGGVVRTNYACDAVVLGETGVVNRLVVDGQPIIGQ